MHVYQVKLEHPRDHTTYYVTAATVTEAAGLALARDGALVPIGPDEMVVPARVVSVAEWASPDQLVSQA